jgi:hypothetical protein
VVRHRAEAGDDGYDGGASEAEGVGGIAAQDAIGTTGRSFADVAAELSVAGAVGGNAVERAEAGDTDFEIGGAGAAFVFDDEPAAGYEEEAAGRRRGREEVMSRQRTLMSIIRQQSTAQYSATSNNAPIGVPLLLFPLSHRARNV